MPESVPVRIRIGSAIKRARTDAGMSQEALGQAVGVVQPLVSRWENHVEEDISTRYLLAIADATGITLAELFRLAEQLAKEQEGA